MPNAGNSPLELLSVLEELLESILLEELEEELNSRLEELLKPKLLEELDELEQLENIYQNTRLFLFDPSFTFAFILVKDIERCFTCSNQGVTHARALHSSR